MHILRTELSHFERIGVCKFSQNKGNEDYCTLGNQLPSTASTAKFSEKYLPG